MQEPNLTVVKSGGPSQDRSSVTPTTFLPGMHFVSPVGTQLKIVEG